MLLLPSVRAISGSVQLLLALALPLTFFLGSASLLFNQPHRCSPSSPSIALHNSSTKTGVATAPLTQHPSSTSARASLLLAIHLKLILLCSARPLARLTSARFCLLRPAPCRAAAPSLDSARQPSLLLFERPCSPCCSSVARLRSTALHCLIFSCCCSSSSLSELPLLLVCCHSSRSFAAIC